MTATARLFVDEFDRPDGPLGPQWIDGHDVYPEWFEPLGIVSEKVHCTNPKSRPGAPYASHPSGQAVNPPHDGKLYHGIGCAWRETGSRAVRVLVRWSGDIGVSEESHMEATPLLHVSNEAGRFGFGVWPGELLGTPVLFAGCIGAPPERFIEYGIAVHAFTHTDNTERDIEIRSDGTNATVYLDGSLLTSWSDGDGTNLAIPAELKYSTLHGFAVDGHFTDPSRIPALPFLTRVEIEAESELGWVSNEGDTITGSLTVDPGTGSVRVVADALGAASLRVFASDANTDAILAFGSFLGTPLIGIGPGNAPADLTIGRYGAEQLTISGANGVVVAGHAPLVNAQTGTSYTVAATDKARTITRSNGSASTMTWPRDADASIPVGTIIEVVNLGAGTVTHSAGTSPAALVTGSVTSQAQGVRITAIKVAANTWSLS